MEQRLNWDRQYNEALDLAKKAGKPLLIFFHSVHCSGCKAMIEKTLPDPDVTAMIGAGFVPAMFEVSEPQSQELVRKYGAEWTPTFIIADQEGNEAYRIVGYLPPLSYMAGLTFGEGKLAFKRGSFNQATRCFEKVYTQYPQAEIAPEAMYYAGVSRYKQTGDVSALNAAYEQLSKRYPDSDWTKKASVWKK